MIRNPKFRDVPVPVMLSDDYYPVLEELRGKRILLRVDFNIKIKDGNVLSDFRIKRVLPTIKKFVDAGAKIILLAHIDDKEGGTLEPIARYLVTEYPKLYFVKDIFSEDCRSAVNNMRDGDVVLFENLRKWDGEKANDPEFVKHLVSFGDIYVNDAFSVSHREHASIVGIPLELPAYYGYLMAQEIERLGEVFRDPPRPFLAVLGGAKFETKVPLVQKFLELSDLVLVGGALANDFLKAKGFFLGDSLVSDSDPKRAKDLLEHSKLIVPLDVYTTYKGERVLKHMSEIGVGEKIVDVGTRTVKMLKIAVADSDFVMWNGPLGKIEDGFTESTEAFIRVLVESKATVVVGGGDVVSVIERMGLMDKFSFISTGGGAMLDFLADENLAGINAVYVGYKNRLGMKQDEEERLRNEAEALRLSLRPWYIVAIDYIKGRFKKKKEW
jgi:phosphoglycerate kinase